MQQQWTISRLDWDMQWKVDFIQQPAMTISVAGLRRSSKALPKANLHQEKVMVTGSLLPVWSTTAFWILVKPLPLRSMLSKLTRCSKTCNACSVHWSTERAQFFSMTMPDCMSHNLCFKLNELGYQVLPHLPYSPGLLPTNYHFFKHFCNFLQGKCFHNKPEAKSSFHEFVEFQSMDFCATRINQLISCWQKCVDSNGSHFD